MRNIDQDRSRLRAGGVSREDIFFAEHLASAISESLYFDEWKTPAQIFARYREINRCEGFEIDARPPWKTYINDSDWSRYTGVTLHAKAMAYAIKWAILGWD